MPQRYNTGNSRPSNSMKDLNDNALAFDDYMNSDGDTFIDRFEKERDSLYGTTKKIISAANVAVEETRQNLIPLSRQYMTLADAQADIANIPDGSTTYVRSPDGGTLADEYINNGGTLAATGRAMPSMTALTTGYVTVDAKGAADITAGLVINADGSTQSNASWNAYYLKAREGETVTYSGTVGSNTVGEEMAYLIQLDSNKSFVAPMATWTSTGSPTDKSTLSATATQDGYIYVRVRDTAEFTLTQRKKTILVESDIDVAGGVAGYATDSVLFGYEGVDAVPLATEVNGSVLNADGTTTPAAAFSMYYVPVKKHQAVDFTGKLGSASYSEQIPQMIQCDADKNVVSVLKYYVSKGVTEDGSMTAIAAQDGFIAVRVRKSDITGILDFSIVLRKARTFTEETADQSGGAASSDRVGMIEKNLGYFDISKSQDNEFGIFYALNADGTKTATESFITLYVPAKPGDSVKYRGPVGVNSTGNAEWMFQVDENKNFVSVLTYWASTGAIVVRELEATATQDGYIAIRHRLGTSPFVLSKKLSTFAPGDEYRESVDELDAIQGLDSRVIADYTCDESVLTKGKVINADGSVTNANGWWAYFIPVKAGDVIRLRGWLGALSTTGTYAPIIQCDASKNFVGVLATFTNAGRLVDAAIEGTATQDGYVYVRVRMTAAQYYDHKVEKIKPESVLARRVNALSSVPENRMQATIERLPFELDNYADYNFNPVSQDNVVIAGDYMYVVGVSLGRNPVILQRSIYGGAWQKFDLSTISGNPFNSPNEPDGHNLFSLVVTKEGYVIVAGNMHAHPCRAAITTNPHDISAWEAISFTAFDLITYPRFVTFSDGTVCAFYRVGRSGDGAYYMSTFDDATKTFINETKIIDATDSNPYEQRIVVDDNDRLHLCWGYRQSAGNADTNYGMFYGVSADKGQTFTSAAGAASFALPMTESNSERIANIAQSSGYVNQCGSCTDVENRFQTVIWQHQANGRTQVVRIRWTGSSWATDILTDYEFTVITATNILVPIASRPVLARSRYGRVFMLYHTTQMGRENQIRAVDCTDPDNLVEWLVGTYNPGAQELVVNTSIAREHNQLMIMLSRGPSYTGTDTSTEPYTAEPAHLLTAVLPS